MPRNLLEARAFDARLVRLLVASHTPAKISEIAMDLQISTEPRFVSN